MKYTQYSQKKKGNSAFYITIALCLVLVGAAAWFSLAGITNNTPKTKAPESSFPKNTSEYNSNDNAYTESKQEPSSTISSNPADTPASKEQYSATNPAKKKVYALPVNGEILKDFSLKALQYSATYNDMRIHAAVDIACNEGTLVTAATDGLVKEVTQTVDYGKCVTIDHGDGLVIKYCGLKNITVEKDAPIKMGDSIGAVATIPCESSDQSHIHIEAYQDNKPVSILKFFQ